MGRSEHRSKKRKRSSSRDRLAGIEKKLSRLISVLSEREVRGPQALSLSPSNPSVLAHQDRASDSEQDVIATEEIFIPVSDGNSIATPASQERVPHDSGVYEFPRSVNPDSGIDTTFSDSRNNPSSVVAQTTEYLEEIPPYLGRSFRRGKLHPLQMLTHCRRILYLRSSSARTWIHRKPFPGTI